MLRKFFDLAETIKPETAITIGLALFICMFAGFAVNMITAAQERERRR